MKHLVDSDWVIDFLKGRPNARAVLESRYSEGLAISIITYAEVYEGIHYGSDPPRNEAVFRRFLQGVRIIGISRPVARCFVALRGLLRSRGDLIPQPDLIIAATAVEHRLIWLTRNTRHCARIPGLQLYQPV